jgi:hypothetical protein
MQFDLMFEQLSILKQNSVLLKTLKYFSNLNSSNNYEKDDLNLKNFVPKQPVNSLKIK